MPTRGGDQGRKLGRGVILTEQEWELLGGRSESNKADLFPIEQQKESAGVGWGI
jgi:hypothetical protein